MLFEQKREIYYSQLDVNKNVSGESVLQFFQDIAVAHTSKSGYTLEKLSGLEKAWILLSMHVKFTKPITLDSEIKINTWTYDFARVCGPRAYQVVDVHTNEEYALASAMWTYVDTKTGRPCEIPSDMISFFGNGEAPDISYLRRAPSFSSDKLVFDFTVLKRDLDSNGHMNNVKYFSYALEALPENTKVLETEIFYKHSIFGGENIEVYAENITEDTVALTFKNKEGTPCAYIKLFLG